jgi:hypothetical protein
MPDEVYDGPTVQAIDDFFSENIEENLKLAKNLLQANSSLAAIIAALPSAKKSPRFQHPVSSSPLKGSQFESVLRQGYLEAIDRALGHSPPVPIKTVWKTGKSDEFTTSVADQGSRVTMTLVIPRNRVRPSDLQKYKKV